jgi:hypothetical protein
VANPVREALGPFIVPQGNLAIRCQKPEHVRVSGRTGHRLWNPTKKSDKAGVTRDKAERLNMSGLGVGHVRVRSLEPE